MGNANPVLDSYSPSSCSKPTDPQEKGSKVCDRFSSPRFIGLCWYAFGNVYLAVLLNIDGIRRGMWGKCVAIFRTENKESKIDEQQQRRMNIEYMNDLNDAR